MFGTELLVAPITTPADRETGLARVKAWLPEGEWVDVFTGTTYRGGRTLHLYRDLGSIPVLARAGAVVPMVPAEAVAFGADPSSRVEVRVYAGADGEFTLVEDRDDSRWARTRITYDDASGRVTVHDVEGDASTLPADRTYETVVVGGEQDTVARVFEVLDRAQTGFELKAAAYEAVRTSATPADALVALQALEVSPFLLGAVTELLTAR
jgi:alpha-glucosidase (family GH31 glycosyl hydrolase)